MRLPVSIGLWREEKLDVSDEQATINDPTTHGRHDLQAFVRAGHERRTRHQQVFLVRRH
jgi:hypothetical protein